MGELKKLALTTIAVTPSGALSPGPLSAVAVSAGLSLGYFGGLLVSLGHMVVELPYVVLLYISLEKTKHYLEKIKIPLNIFVTIFLAFYAYLLLQTALHPDSSLSNGKDMSISNIEAITAGMALTGLNAYFLMWWITVGYPLVSKATEIGKKGLVVMYTSHVWMDYAWLILLATAGGGVAGIMSIKVYQGIMIALAIILGYFAVKIFTSTIKEYMG